MSSITSIEQLKQRIRCCRELAIPRPFFDYTHHVFIGEVDENGCYIYHYTAYFKSFEDHSLGKVAKVRLDYTNHKIREVRSIFNFEKGDRVIIVDRSDYPINAEAEKDCIKRAESRLGEENYSFICNNCESYVNWIFKNDNTSNQIKKSLKKQMIGNGFDGIFSRGVQRPSQGLHPVVHKTQLKKKGKSEKTKRLQHSLHSSGNDTEFQKCTNDKKSLEFQRNTEIEKVSNFSTDTALIKDNKSADKTKHLDPELAKGEESQECSTLTEGIDSPNSSVFHTNSEISASFLKVKEKSKGIEEKDELDIKDSSKISKPVKFTKSSEFAKGSKSQRINRFRKQIKTPKGTVKNDLGIGNKLPYVSNVPEKLEVPKGTKLQRGSKFQTDTFFSKGTDTKPTRTANINGLLKLSKFQTDLEFRNNDYSPPSWNQRYQDYSRDMYIRNGPEYSNSSMEPTSLWSPMDISLIRAEMNSKDTEFSKGLNLKDSRFPVSPYIPNSPNFPKFIEGTEFQNTVEMKSSLHIKIETDRNLNMNNVHMKTNLYVRNQFGRVQELNEGVALNDNRYSSVLPTEKLHHVEEKYQSRYQQIDKCKDWVQKSRDPIFKARQYRPVFDANAQQILSQSNRNDVKPTLNPQDMVSKSDTKENQYSKGKTVESVVQNQSSPDENGDEVFKQEINSTLVSDVCSISVLESIFLLRKISQIYNDKHMTKAQKRESIGREVGSSILGVTCSIFGQVLVPFPGLGGWVGGFIGNAVGGLLGGTLFS